MSEPSFTEFIEVQVEGLGPARVMRGNLSQKQWRRLKEKAAPTEAAPQEPREDLGEENVRWANPFKALEDLRSEAVVLQDERGVQTVIPRGDMNEKRWNAVVEKAAARSDYAFTQNEEGKITHRAGEEKERDPEVEVKVLDPTRVVRDVGEVTATPVEPEVEVKVLDPTRVVRDVGEVTATPVEPEVEDAGETPAPAKEGSGVLGQITKLIQGAVGGGTGGGTGTGAEGGAGGGAAIPSGAGGGTGALGPSPAGGFESGGGGTPAVPMGTGGAGGVLSGAGGGAGSVDLVQALAAGIPGVGLVGATGLLPGPTPVVQDPNAVLPPPGPVPGPGAPTPSVPGLGWAPPRLEKVDPAEIKRIVKEGKEVEAAKGELQAAGLKAQAETMQRGMEEAAKVDAAEAVRRETFNKSLADAEQAYRQVADERVALSKKSVDPHRWWNSKTDGEKVASYIAAALFGFMGQGMQYLQRIDAAIDRDVRLQQAEFERQDDALKMKMDVSQNLYGMLRQRGLDAYGAYIATRAQKMEDVKMQVQIGAANTGSEMAKQNAAGLMVAMDQWGAAENAKRIDHENNNALQKSQLALQVALARQRAAAAARKGSVKDQRVIAHKIGSISHAIATARRGLELVENKGLIDRQWRSLKEVFDSKEAAAAAHYEVIKSSIASDVARGALQKEEAERLLPLFGVRSGIYDTTPRLEEMVKTLEAQKAQIQKDYNESGILPPLDPGTQVSEAGAVGEPLE